MDKTLDEVVYAMLVENTGMHMLDSGSINGRNWQRNQGKTLEDFKKSPEVEYDAEGCKMSDEIQLTISVFHSLTDDRAYELDDVCQEFNKINADAKDWDGKYYGVSKKGQNFLDKHGFIEDGEFNTYNGDSMLSQTLQGTYLKEYGSAYRYLLLQVHGGADVRGGYTNARLFSLASDWLNNEIVEGTINGIGVSTMYSSYGNSLVSVGGEGEPEEGEPVPLKGDGTDVIELSLTGF